MPPKKQVVPDPLESAPWYKIPNVQAVSVEHPCVVKNVDKAIQTLGGDQAIKTFLRNDHVEKPIHLKFHPDDPFSQPILSVNTQANNVLLKITVPKRTGRKRKRGSNDPFVEDLNEPPMKKSARYLLQSLQADKGGYEIEPVASIPVVHIFRTMPDFAYSTSQSQFLNQFRDKVLPFQYPLLSDFKLDPARGLENTEIIPPSSLSTMAYPSNYAYRQNPAIKAFIDPTTGTRRLFNTQAPARIHTIRCQWDTPPTQIPTTISPTTPPLESEPHNLRGLVTILLTIFARRPIWTRRGLANQLPTNAPIFLAKYAIGYVAYAMRSGPWRDTYIRLGVDPRSSPSYRQYQTLMLQLVSSKKSSAENRRYEDASHSWRRDPDKNSHLFTGKGRVPFDGKSWQLCDLLDPLLKSLVEIPELHLRAECEHRYFGWYQNGTWCKLKILLKAKIDLLMEGITPDDDFERKCQTLLDLPESYHVPAVPEEEVRRLEERGGNPQREGSSLWKSAGREGDPLLGFLPRSASKMELEWAAQYRAMCRAPQGQLPHSGRLSKSKALTRKSYVGGDEERESGEADGVGGTMGGENADQHDRDGQSRPERSRVEWRDLDAFEEEEEEEEEEEDIQSREVEFRLREGEDDFEDDVDMDEENDGGDGDGGEMENDGLEG